MVIIKISGGLGNQLFQYAFGKLLQKKNIKVKFDIQTAITAKNFTKRDLDLQKFVSSISLANKKEVEQYIWFPKGALWRVERKLSQFFAVNKKHYIQKNAHHLIENLQDNIYYDGYWQCHQYVDEVRDLMLSEIKPDQIFYENYQHLLNQMAIENSVAIHVRRGDYINIPINKKIFEVCDFNYYENAIKYFKNKLSNPKFYIFTQDIDWVEKFFIGDEFQIVKGGSAIDDMMLMSKSKNNIIANSTFSWWSAWLNTNENKVVIAPKRWYKEAGLNNETKNLIPSSWIRI